MFSEGVLRNVKQLMFELHTPEVSMVGLPSKRQDFKNMADILQQIEALGFRKFRSHTNPNGLFMSPVTGRVRSCCYELYYVNVNFIEL